MSENYTSECLNELLKKNMIPLLEHVRKESIRWRKYFRRI